MTFGLKDLLFDIVEDSTTSIGQDVADLESEDEIETDHEPEETETETEIEAEEEQEEQEDEQEPEAIEVTTYPFERPSIKQLNEAYPDLFKKFPSLRDMYFRETEYSKLFPTIDEAKEANENNVAFTEIREDVFTGDGSKLFSAIKEVNEKNLDRFASGVLTSLYKVSPNSFWRASNPLVEDIARNMYNKGVKEGNESLQNAARYLSDYFFGSVDIAEGKKTTIVKDQEDPELKKQRDEFDNSQHTAFRNSVESDIKIQLLQLIDTKDLKSGKSRLDPDGIFSSFIRSTVIDHIINELGSQLTIDKDHINYMNSLWSRAKRNGRTDKDKSSIISAYLARAKSLIPSIRSKYVSEALGQKMRTSSHQKERVSSLESRRDSGSLGRSSNANNKGYNPKHIDYDKTSDEDILNDDIKYK